MSQRKPVTRINFGAVVDVVSIERGGRERWYESVTWSSVKRLTWLVREKSFGGGPWVVRPDEFGWTVFTGEGATNEPA